VFLKLKPAKKAGCKLSTTYFKCNRDLENIYIYFFQTPVFQAIRGAMRGAGNVTDRESY
jgi:hypothetical protein